MPVIDEKSKALGGNPGTENGLLCPDCVSAELGTEDFSVSPGPHFPTEKIRNIRFSINK